jgi:hypothetical protein
MAMNRRNQAVTLLQATQSSPVLAHLAELAAQSSARLKVLEPLIPKSLLNCIRPGPIEGAVWCLLLDNNAIAAKLRQLLPALESHLRTKGFGEVSIRLRVAAKK